MSATHRPPDWKHFDDFAAGIATNRLPASEALVGQVLPLHLPGRVLTLRPDSRHTLRWEESGEGLPARSGSDRYEAVEVAPDTWFVDLTRAALPDEAWTVIANTRTRRVLAVRCRILGDAQVAGEPRVAQDFLAGTLGSGPALAGSTAPHETRELIGLRTFQTYSPEHTYEHTYLSSQRYAWQCLVGVQRGHGDVDRASYYKFDDQQYIFTFREYRIPVASVFFFNFESGRSTGKFLGLTGAGEISNQSAGAFMRKASMTVYPSQHEPV